MRKSLNTLIAVAYIASGCATNQIQVEDFRCIPAKAQEEAKRYLAMLKDSPYTANGIILPIEDKKHAKCIDNILRQIDERIGIIFDGESYLIMEVVY